MTNDATETELLDRLGHGDREAFGMLVTRYQSVVCGVAYSVIGDVARSEDVAQEAFLAAWKQRGKLRDVQRFKSWLCGITRNLACLALRKERRTEPLDLHEPAIATHATAEEQAVSREELNLVWKLLEALPVNYREPLVLFYREEASVARVAEALDLSEDAVKQRLSRGREMLRDEVAATIENVLRRSAPGAAFLLSVMAAVHGLGVATASAAAIGAFGKSATPVLATSAKAGTLSALFGSLLGLLGATFGTWASWQTARFPRERNLIRRAIFVYAIAFAIFVAPFLAMRLGWKPSLYGTRVYLIGYGIWMAGFYVAMGIWTWRCIRRHRLIIAEEVAANSLQFPPTRLQRRMSEWKGRRWTSRWTFLGLPLVQINVSDPSPGPGDLLIPRVARGWIAVGDRAYGVILAIGNIAVGGIAYGGVSLGGIAIGGLSAGLVTFGGAAIGAAAFGGAAIGVAAVGGVAIGWLALGGAAIAWNGAKGGFALARHYAVGGEAVARHANDDAAKSFFADSQFFSNVEPLLFKWECIQEQGWYQPAILAVTAVIVTFFWLLIFRYHRPPRDFERVE
jgi:zinc protease